MEQAKTVKSRDWYDQMNLAAVACGIDPPRTITDTYNLMCNEVHLQGNNVDQAGPACVHTSATQPVQMIGGGSGNSGGSNSGGGNGGGTLLCYICDTPDHGFHQCPLFGRNTLGHNGNV